MGETTVGSDGAVFTPTVVFSPTVVQRGIILLRESVLYLKTSLMMMIFDVNGWSEAI